jgi:4-amino-4-deoxy-L-arabinose transferase-like glycosyltransferase
MTFSGAATAALAMMRDDWWWPWWVSTLIDLGVVAIAVTAFLMSSRRGVRLVAGTFVLAGLVAAVMAPIVMTEDSDEPTMERMQTDEAPTMRP